MKLNINQIYHECENNDSWSIPSIGYYNGEEFNTFYFGHSEFDVLEDVELSESMYFVKNCMEGHIELVQSSLNDESVLAELCPTTLKNAYVVACNNGHIDIVNELLTHRQYELFVNKAHYIPFEETEFNFAWAVKKGLISTLEIMVRYLLENNPEEYKKVERKFPGIVYSNLPIKEEIDVYM